MLIAKVQVCLANSIHHNHLVYMDSYVKLWYYGIAIE